MKHLGDITKISGYEIEPFCVAVATKHFGDEDTEDPGDIREYL